MDEEDLLELLLIIVSLNLFKVLKFLMAFFVSKFNLLLCFLFGSLLHSNSFLFISFASFIIDFLIN